MCSNVFAVGGATVDRGVGANRELAFHFSFRVNKQLELLRLLLVQVETNSASPTEAILPDT